jgi:transcriptional regulator of arginine metabolism
MYNFAAVLHKYTEMNKTKRLLEIRKIIQSQKIGSQDELLAILNTRGYDYTQATLSRDLKYLRVGKMPDTEKGLIYVLPEGASMQQPEPSNVLSDQPTGFLSIEFNSNMAVIKTLPGFASSLAYRIDGMNSFEILGTIAGDDTILVIGREGIPRPALVQSLRPVIH